jgi:hypothetical protein
LILGYRPNSVRSFDWLPFTPPLVASSVLQDLIHHPSIYNHKAHV